MNQKLTEDIEVLAKLLDKLYTVNVLTSTYLAQTLNDVCPPCGKVKYLKRYIQDLESMNINILPDVMIHKLKFKILLYIVNVKKVRRCSALDNIASTSPYVRAINLIYPKKVVLLLYIPESIKHHDGVKPINNKDKNIEIYGMYDYTVRSKPLPKQLFMLIQGSDQVFSEKSLNECVDNPLSLPEDWDNKPKISKLSLQVLDVLLLDPKLTVTEVKDKLHERLGKELSLDKVRKYIDYAEKFIYGYRVGITSTHNVSNAKFCLIIENVNEPAKFCLSIVRHPLTLSCSWSVQGKVSTCFSRPLSNYTVFKESLYSFVSRFKGVVVDEFEYFFEKGYTTVINIPYTEWVPILRSWIKPADPMDIVSSVVDKLKSSDCIEV